MLMAFPSRAEYERLIYTLPSISPWIEQSTLHFYTTSATGGTVRGIVHCQGGLELRVNEVIDFARGLLLDYSYSVYVGDERLYWYDPQPHPDDPTLSSTHPHHKHIPPDIRHHRVPAPGISFTHPNLPFLIREIEERLKKTQLNGGGGDGRNTHIHHGQ